MCELFAGSHVYRFLPFHTPHSRKLFLTRRFQLGLSVPDSTLVAISQGTSDHSVLHPALLHASQLMGTAIVKNNVSNEREAETDPPHSRRTSGPRPPGSRRASRISPSHCAPVIVLLP
jgi:hypothetical protein